MSLFAYENPRECPENELFEHVFVVKVADFVNSAILGETNALFYFLLLLLFLL